MALESKIDDILGEALRTIEASADNRKDSLPVRKLKHEMLHTIAQLCAPRVQVIAPQGWTEKPDDAA